VLVEDITVPDNGRARGPERKNWGIVEGKGRTYSELDRWFREIPSASGMNDHRVVGNQVKVVGPMVPCEPWKNRMHGTSGTTSPNQAEGVLKLSFAKLDVPPRSRNSRADPPIN